MIHSLSRQTVAGYPVLGRIADARNFRTAAFVCGIGSPATYTSKPAIIAKSGIDENSWYTVIHPLACVSPRAIVGKGSVFLAGSSVGARATVGKHVMVLQNSVISHDSHIGDCTAIATGVCVSGMVSVDRNCYLGSNCCIRDRVNLGAQVLVGIGAVVVSDFPSRCVVCGSPARILRRQ